MNSGRREPRRLARVALLTGSVRVGTVLAARVIARLGKPGVVSIVTLALIATACGSQAESPGVYVVPAGDGAPRWIAASPAAPVWSPSAELVAWGSEDGLFVFDLGSGMPRRLSPAPVAGRPAFAPDGSRIAIVDAEKRMLRVVEAASGRTQFEAGIADPDAQSNVFPLVTLGGPAWSPDGRRIAFACWDGTGDEICVIGSDGRGRRQLTQIEPPSPPGSSSGRAGSRAIANVGQPAWSPNGRHIAVAVYPERRGAPNGIFVIDTRRGEARKVSSLQPNSWLAWFSDGTALLFAAERDGRSDAYRLVLESGEAENLTTNLPDGARYPALSPGGERLAAMSADEIVILDLPEGEPMSLGTAGTDRFPAWSPDGETISFAADDDPIQWYE